MKLVENWVKCICYTNIAVFRHLKSIVKVAIHESAKVESISEISNNSDYFYKKVMFHMLFRYINKFSDVLVRQRMKSAKF